MPIAPLSLRARALAALLCAAPCAQAEPPRRHVEPAEAPRTEGDAIEETYFDTPFLVASTSPIYLLGLIPSVGAEVKLLGRASLGGALALGRVKTADPRDPSATVRKTYAELSAYGRYYAIGSFQSGLYGGVEVSYAHADTDQLIKLAASNLASGLALGPQVGFKVTSRLGPVLDVFIIPRFYAYRPAPDVPSPSDTIDIAGRLIINFNIQLGYAF